MPVSYEEAEEINQEAGHTIVESNVFEHGIVDGRVSDDASILKLAFVKEAVLDRIIQVGLASDLFEVDGKELADPFILKGKRQ